MSKHTPGPLEVAVEVFDNEGCPETVIQGLAGAASVAVCLDFGENNPLMRYANARRLVACWNACEGVPTSVLDDVMNSSEREFLHHFVAMQAQRDELLGALQMLLAISGEINYAPNGLLEMALDSDDQETRNQANAHLCARAAIAKATGEAA